MELLVVGKVGGEGFGLPEVWEEGCVDAYGLRDVRQWNCDANGMYMVIQMELSLGGPKCNGVCAGLSFICVLLERRTISRTVQL